MPKTLGEIKRLGLVFRVSGKVFFVIDSRDVEVRVVSLGEADWRDEEAIKAGRCDLATRFCDDLVYPITDSDYRDLRPGGFYYATGQKVKRIWSIGELHFFVTGLKQKRKPPAPTPATVSARPSDPFANW